MGRDLSGEALTGDVRTLQVADGTEKPSLQVERRTAIKLAQSPTIVVCMPIGDKEHTCEHKCAGCGASYRGPGFRAHGLVPIQWAANHMQIVPPLNVSMSYLFEFGRLAAEAREILTHNALRMNPKYLFYWDDDTLIPPLALYSMHNFLETHPEVGAVTGVYCTREKQTQPIIYKRHGQGPYWGFEAGDYATPEEIFSSGAGCLLVRADAVRKMTPPYWADAQELRNDEDIKVRGRIVWGHDVRFCLKLKQEANVPLYVMGEVLCGHWDINEQVEYKLPADSPPMRRWRFCNWQEYWADTWGHDRVNGAPRYQKVYDWILERMEWDRNVVDVGCGVGILMQRLLSERHCHVRGYDASLQAVQFAKSLYLDVEELDVRNLEAVHIGDADTLVCTFVLEYISDAMRENIFRVAPARAIFAFEPGPQKLRLKDFLNLAKKYYANIESNKLGKVWCIRCTEKITDGEQYNPALHVLRHGTQHECVGAGTDLREGDCST